MSALSPTQRRRRARHMMFWRVVNPPTRPLAGLVPWWVLLETIGRRTGQPRRIPLAAGPNDGNVTWLNSVHGRAADWVRNLEANPEVRIRLRGRWHQAHARVVDHDESVAGRFSAYARVGPRTMGIEPALVRVERLD